MTLSVSQIPQKYVQYIDIVKSFGDAREGEHQSISIHPLNHKYNTKFMGSNLSLDKREMDGRTGRLTDRLPDRQRQPSAVTLIAHACNHRS